jgi:hypothetical protein
MPLTELALCNLALGHLGEAPIAALDSSTAASRACVQCYGTTRDEVLRSHRWNFAAKRAILTPPWQSLTSYASYTLDGVAVVRVNKTAHGYTTGQRVRLKDADIATGAWIISVIDSASFALVGCAYNASVLTYTSALMSLVPTFGWDYQFILPSDCLRIMEEGEGENGQSKDWIIEGRLLLSNRDTCNLVYVSQVTNVTVFDSVFVQALAVRLAVVLSEIIRGTTGKTEQLNAQYERITAPLARRVDANEGRRRAGLRPMMSLAIKARLGRDYYGTGQDSCSVV